MVENEHSLDRGIPRELGVCSTKPQSHACPATLLHHVVCLELGLSKCKLDGQVDLTPDVSTYIALPTYPHSMLKTYGVFSLASGLKKKRSEPSLWMAVQDSWR